MIVRGEFADLLGTRTIDECSPVRHFFARLRLCRHKTRSEKTSVSKTLKQAWYKAYEDFPDDIVEEETTTAEEHLAAVIAEWGLIYDYRVPFSSIMGVEKWVEICEVFFEASRHLMHEKEEEKDDLTNLLDPKYDGVFDKVVHTIREIDEQEDPE